MVIDTVPGFPPRNRLKLRLHWRRSALQSTAHCYHCLNRRHETDCWTVHWDLHWRGTITIQTQIQEHRTSIMSLTRQNELGSQALEGTART